MSEVITATTVVIASQVITGSVAAPTAAVVGTSLAAIAGVATVGCAAGIAALGYALTCLPIWKDLEQSETKHCPKGSYNLDSFEQDFLDVAERNYERLLQVAVPNVRAEAFETVAALIALKNTEFVAAVAEDQFPKELHSITAQLPQVSQMNNAQIGALGRQTADLLEKSLIESQRRIHTFVAREFVSAMQEAGWTVKDEARTEKGSAYLATNRAGQSLAACLENNGTITTDMAGFSGRSCEAAVRTIFEGLEKRGIRLIRRREQPHYLFQGGAIIGRVSRAEQILGNAKQYRANQQERNLPASLSPPNGDTRRQQVRKGYVLNRLRKLTR